MKKHRKVYSKGDIAFNIVNYTVFFLITLACVFPFYYLFINTISSNELVRLGKIQLYPREIQFENYVQVMKIEGIADALLVSVARTVLGTLWTVAGCAFLGYLVTKQEMWLRKVWYRMIVITMYFSAGLIPWYMNLRMLGFLDNFWVYVIPGLVSPYNVILVKTFIEGMPPALEESATLDGAGYIRCFVSVVMPLITPILATLCIFSAVGQWNSFTDTMMLMPSGKYYTLQLGQFTRNYTQTVKRAADNKRRYAPGWVHSTCLLRGFPKGAAPHLAHDFAEQSVVCYTLCRRCPENTVAAGEGKGI